MSTSIVQRPSMEESLTRRAFYDEIDSQQLAAIEKSVARGLNPPEIAWYLEMARTLNLSPWAREIYAAKSQSGQLLIMVGRDGLLRKAEDFPDYRGYDAGVVYEGDVFRRVAPDPKGETLRERAGVVHETPGFPEKGRPILGAWAVAERAGRPPRVFLARLDEYLPRLTPDKMEKSSWGNQTSVMIEKVAISVVHRTLCNLSGVYLQEEVDRLLMDEEGRSAAPRPEETLAEMRSMIEELEVDASVREAILAGITELNALSPNAWGPAQVQMKLAGRDEAQILRELATLRRDVEAARARAADRPAADADGEAEEVTDAEVVTEPVSFDEELDGEADPDSVESIEAQLLDLQAALEDPDLEGPQREALEARVEELQAARDQRGS